MIITENGNPLDPNYAHLHMLSFAYNPSNFGPHVPFTYGVIAEFISDPFSSQRKFLTCYNTGFVAFYSTQNGGNINGHTQLPYSEVAQLASFEQFIAAQSDITEQSDTGDGFSLRRRSKQLVEKAGGYLEYTKETINIKEHQEVQFWLLTSSGVFSGGADLFEIRDKTSVWTDLFNQVQSIAKDCQSAGPDKFTSVAARM